MANKFLKGLTVKIGGDTSDLAKSLDKIDKKSRDLSSELSQINQLLKFDPSNTEALAQKQKVLADAISNTESKLDTLREAEKQVQAQFEKGEVSEAQYRALQREILITEKKLDGYKNAAEETAEAVKNLGKKTGGANDETKKTKKGADEASDSLDDMADSADKAADASEGLGSTLGSVVGGGLKALAAGVTAVVGAMVASAETSREYRAEMGKLQTGFDAAGHSAETATATYKALQGVIGETDQSVEAAQQIALLAESEQDAAKWAELAAGVVGRFGDALQPETFFEAANETLKLNESTAAYTQMLEQAGYDVEKFNKGLQACTTQAEKQAYMLEVTDQILGEAAEKYREVNAEVIRANEANEAWAASMGEVGGAVEPILSDVKLLGAALLSELVPGVESVASAFRGMLNGDEGAAADLGAALSGIFTQLLSKITEMAPMAAEMAINLITTLTTSLISALPQLITAGAEMVMALIQGLVQAFPQIAQAIQTVLPQILTMGGQLVSQLLTGIANNLPNLLQGAMNLITNFTTGLQTYLPLVLQKGSEILMNLVTGIATSLPSLVSQALDALMQFATTLYDNAPTLIQTGFDMLSKLVEGVLSCLPELIARVPEIVSKFANTINDNFPTILKKGVELLWQIIKGILSVIPDLIANIPQIITAIVDVWEAFNWLQLGKNAIKFLKDGITNMVGSVKTAGKNVMDAASNAIKDLPSKLLNFGKNAVSNLGNAISSGLGAVKSAATGILNGVINTITTLPSKMLNIGKDLVRGLWNGISDMTGWVIGKIQSFGSSVLSGIKKFFGIKSPSRVFRDEVGAMLAEGMAEGIEKNANSPLSAMATLSNDLMGEAETMNGLTLERRLNHTFTAPTVSFAEGGMLAKLDSILAAIEKGQVLLLDGSTLVGATAGKMDNTLGQRHVLVGRGAL